VNNPFIHTGVYAINVHSYSGQGYVLLLHPCTRRT